MTGIGCHKNDHGGYQTDVVDNCLASKDRRMTDDLLIQFDDSAICVILRNENQGEIGQHILVKDVVVAAKNLI